MLSFPAKKRVKEIPRGAEDSLPSVKNSLPLNPVSLPVVHRELPQVVAVIAENRK
jgi:hypothetical protein